MVEQMVLELCASEPEGSEDEIAVEVPAVGSYCVALGAGQGLVEGLSVGDYATQELFVGMLDNLYEYV